MVRNFLCAVRSLVILLALSMSLSASAEEGFFKENTLPLAHRPKNIHNAVKATFRIFGRDARPCSGSFISPDGYFLTALHCISPCLIHHGAAKMARSESADFFTVDKAKSKDVICTDISVEDTSFTSPTLVSTGAGFLESEKGEISAFVKNSVSVISLFKKNLQDFAILKFKTKRPVPCLALAPNDTTPSDALWGIGYPLPVHRKNGVTAGYKTDFAQRQAPFEFRYATWGHSHDLTENQNLNVGEFGNEYLQIHRQIYDPSYYIIASLDGADGMSGGPLIDSHSNMIGILIQRFQGATGDTEFSAPYSEGSTIALKPRLIFESLRSNSQIDTKAIFNCPARP